MAAPNADDFLKRREALRSERSPHEAVWQQLAEYVRPLRTGFASPRRAGDKPGSRLFDGTAPLAADRLAAGLYGLITAPSNEWFSLRHQYDDLNEVQEVKLWMDEVGRLMRQALLGQGLGFYSRIPSFYADLVTFGTAVFYVDDNGGRPWFSHRHLAECYITENAREEVDTVYRVFTWPARSAVERWGDKAGATALKAMEKGEPDRRIEYLHVVEPNPDADPNKVDARAKAFRSVYVSTQDRAVVAVGGYDEMPYMVPRWAHNEAGPYGDGAAILALPDVKTVNAMAKTTLIGAQKAVDPPLLAPDEYAVRGLRTTPGGITYGGTDMAGNPVIRPLTTGGQVGLGLEMEQQRRESIRDAFHSGLLLMVAQPGRTATEVLQSQEEKLRLMAPHLGRIQSEFLDPLLDRLFGILSRAGQLPQPPQVLQQYPQLRVEYVSPLARAAKAAEGAALMRTMDAVLPLAAHKPEILDNFDMDEIARTLADAYGTSPKLLRDRKMVEQERTARAQQTAQQQQLAAATMAAGAAKDLAAAGAGA
ncbi:portal protein [Azospirillum sp. sgz302134]